MQSSSHYSSLLVASAMVTLLILGYALIFNSLPQNSGLEVRFETPTQLAKLPARTAQSLPFIVSNNSNKVVRILGSSDC